MRIQVGEDLVDILLLGLLDSIFQLTCKRMEKAPGTQLVTKQAGTIGEWQSP